MKIKESKASLLFDIFNHFILLLFCLTVIIPMIHVIAISMSSTRAIVNSKVWLLPVEFNLNNYMHVINNSTFLNSFKITAFVVTVGTAINLFITVVTAYSLSKPYLPGRKWIMLVLIFNMIFHSPLIPMYLTMRSLKLINTLWALVLPGALSVFNTILCIAFFKSLPEELFEAARVDGMSEYGILFKIAVPLSKPIIVTLLLFFAVNHWNNYQNALYFITNANLRPLQMYLYSIVASTNMADMGMAVATESAVKTHPEGLKMATVITATIPVVVIYPFLQKHFVKGVMIGSIKG